MFQEFDQACSFSQMSLFFDGRERENNRLLLTDSQTMRGRLLESLSKGGTSDLPRIEQTFSLLAVIWRKPHPFPQKRGKVASSKQIKP